MNKRLKKILREATSSTVTYAEKFVRQDASIPGLTIDGKDIKSFLDSKGFEYFLREDAYHISFDETVLSNKVFSEQEKEAIISHFAGYSKDVKEYFNFNLAVIKKLISSINRMIPSNLQEDEIDVADKIKDSVQKMSYAVSLYDDCIQNKLLILFEQEKETIGARSISAKIHHGFLLMKVMIDLNLLSMRIPLLHQIVYDFFYGPEEEKSIKNDMINQIVDGVSASLFSILTSLNRIEEQTVKTTEQALKDSEITRNMLNELKDNQIVMNNKIDDVNVSIKNRNDEDEPGEIPLKSRVDIIEAAIKHNAPNMIIDRESISRKLRDWDKKIEQKIKIPVIGYVYAKKGDVHAFKNWAFGEFINYYVLSHKPGRGRKRSSKRRSYSSSDAAFNEAAMNMHNKNKNI